MGGRCSIAVELDDGHRLRVIASDVGVRGASRLRVSADARRAVVTPALPAELLRGRSARLLLSDALSAFCGVWNRSWVRRGIVGVSDSGSRTFTERMRLAPRTSAVSLIVGAAIGFAVPPRPLSRRAMPKGPPIKQGRVVVRVLPGCSKT
jgi:hypothetical protein